MTTSTESRVRRFVPGLLLFAAVIVAYAGTFRHGFIWDDNLHVTANPRIVGPEGLKEVWTTSAANYFPLVLTNFWAQHALWGLNPFGYHAVTIACHAICALLLWRVLLALRVPGAWLGAALWALHPVQVESVAWISELKNTQSGIFFLLSILFFVRWLDAPEPTKAWKLYALAAGAGLLALLSKPSTVMLPVALALITWWRRGALRFRDLCWLSPFFALSALAGGWAIWEQRFHSGARGAEWNETLLERVAIAGKTTWFYLWKLLWPHPLIFIYPRWKIAASALDLAPALGVVATLAGLWWRRVPWRAAFVTALYFLALLFPVLDFFDVFFFRYSFVGDHFQYLASMAPLALLGAAIAACPRRVALAGAGGLLLSLGLLTVRQGRIYANSIALWRATVRDNPVATMAWLNLADSLSKDGRHQEAIDCFHRALELRPDDPDGHSDLGCELVLIGRPAEALPEFDAALRLRPNLAETHNNLGNALWYLDRREQSIAEYRRAIELWPEFGDAHDNLGAALAQLGQPREALPHFAAALRANPKHVEAYDNLGNALRALGRLPEAITAHEKALQLRPEFAEAHNNLALDLVGSGRAAEAIAHFQRALALKPDFVAAAGGLARQLVAKGEPELALQQLQTSVRLSPNSAAAHNNLGSFQASAGHPYDAIKEFGLAIRLDPRWVVARMNLGAALGAVKRWPDAAQQFENATKLQPDSAEAHAMLGTARVNAGQLEAAVPCFERALRLQPQSAVWHDQFGQLLRALGRNRETLEEFEKAGTQGGR